VDPRQMRMKRRYTQIVAGFRRVQAVVAGDLIADEFIYGRVERVSREAPVLILRYDATEIVPGQRMLDALPARARARSVHRTAGYVTPVKTRILAGGIHSAKQQVVRIDRAGGKPDVRAKRHAEASLARAIARADVVILSDYGGGLITSALWQRAMKASRRRKPPITLVDSRYALAEFTGMTACTPNESEVEALLGIRIGDDPHALEDAGRRLLERLACEAVLVTRGSRGMALFQQRKPTEHIAIVGSDQVTDTTGAGDTVIATFALALGAGATFSEAAHLANHAAGLVVMKRGTATVTDAELTAAVQGAPDL
jgi:rfaE bifunctional protein kinase chain/domain